MRIPEDQRCHNHHKNYLQHHLYHHHPLQNCHSQRHHNLLHQSQKHLRLRKPEQNKIRKYSEMMWTVVVPEKKTAKEIFTAEACGSGYT